MDTDYFELAEYFSQLTDEELLSRFGAGTLTDTARMVAAMEIRRRGLKPPAIAKTETPAAPEYAGDYVTIARFLNAIEAQVVYSCLDNAGIPAILADAQMVQSNAFLAPILGGARLMVPARHVSEAKAVLAAFDSGAFALRDDDDLT